MNGETPQKPAEGDWQSKDADVSTHDAQPVTHVDTTAPVDVDELPPAPVPAPESQKPVSEGWKTDLEGAALWDSPEFANEQAPAERESPYIAWTASEFIAHEKSMLWYVGLGGVSLLLVLFASFVMHDIIAIIAVIVIAILFVFAASHKPRTLPYQIDHDGVTIAGKLYSYGDFKTFGIVQEGAFSSITLTPLKRFGQPLSIYYPPEDEEKIVEVLSVYMPMAQVNLDFIDRLLRSIHL